jgi:hypothetical protein
MGKPAWVTWFATILIAGCAYGVDDPQPAPDPTPEPRSPPAETLSGELPEAAGPTLKPGIRHAPALENPPLPQILPAPVDVGN